MSSLSYFLICTQTLLTMNFTVYIGITNIPSLNLDETFGIYGNLWGLSDKDIANDNIAFVLKETKYISLNRD